MRASPPTTVDLTSSLDAPGPVPPPTTPTSPASPTAWAGSEGVGVEPQQDPPPEYRPLLPRRQDALAGGLPVPAVPGPSRPWVVPSARPWVQASWLPWGSTHGRDAERHVAQLLRQAELAQKKGEVHEATVLLGAADKACGGAKLAYRHSFFVARPGEHDNPLILTASRDGNQQVLLTLLKVAPRAKHLLFGSLFAQDAAYGATLGTWLTGRGSACRQLLLAGLDDEACENLTVLAEILGAAHDVDPAWHARSSLCAWVSPHVSAIEVASKRGCPRAAKLLTERDPVGREEYRRSTLAAAEQAFELGHFDQAERLSDHLVANALQERVVLATEPRLAQFLGHLFPARSVRRQEKVYWQDRVTGREYANLDEVPQGDRCFFRHTRKYALAVDVERNLAPTRRWLQLATRFGLDMSRITFGHVDFSGAQNIRYWLSDGQQSGQAATFQTPQHGENCTADAGVSFLGLLLQVRALASCTTLLSSRIDAQLVEFVRLNLSDASARQELLAFLQQLRAAHPERGQRFLPLLLEQALQEILPQELRDWIEHA